MFLFEAADCGILSDATLADTFSASLNETIDGLCVNAGYSCTVSTLQNACGSIISSATMALPEETDFSSDVKVAMLLNPIIVDVQGLQLELSDVFPIVRTIPVFYNIPLDTIAPTSVDNALLSQQLNELYRAEFSLDGMEYTVELVPTIDGSGFTAVIRSTLTTTLDYSRYKTSSTLAEIKLESAAVSTSYNGVDLIAEPSNGILSTTSTDGTSPGGSDSVAASDPIVVAMIVVGILALCLVLAVIILYRGSEQKALVNRSSIIGGTPAAQLVFKHSDSNASTSNKMQGAPQQNQQGQEQTPFGGHGNVGLDEWWNMDLQEAGAMENGDDIARILFQNTTPAVGNQKSPDQINVGWSDAAGVGQPQDRNEFPTLANRGSQAHTSNEGPPSGGRSQNVVPNEGYNPELRSPLATGGMLINQNSLSPEESAWTPQHDPSIDQTPKHYHPQDSDLVPPSSQWIVWADGIPGKL